MWSLLLSSAIAKSWCAAPLVAHEWGVTVLTGTDAAPKKPQLPAHFHTPGDPFAVQAAAVRTLPADNGVRTLPVVHFYGPERPGDIPLGVEVGFTEGEASVWYPAVDERIPADRANSPDARAERSALVQEREQLGVRSSRPDLGPDPTRQLHWSALTLSAEAPTQPVTSDVTWIAAARALPGARWVGQGPETERFLFYEADTIEAPAVRIERTHDGVALTNTSKHAVHDVLYVAEGVSTRVPAIGPGATARQRLLPFRADEVRDWLTERWSTGAEHDPQFDWSGASDDCVMMRDPMKPLELASDHRLYPSELALLWSVWEKRLLEPAAAHLVYRESTAALDEVMPVSLYTDMRHDPSLSRLGVVLVEELP